jgi:hypothetical protein
MVARAKTVKKVWVKIAQTGSRKMAKINFTQRVGTMNPLGCGARRVVGTTYGATLTPRRSFRPRTMADLRFIFEILP